ncbi:MAG TPA: matrixin family metalloprotease [Candidatus Limnocylindria bacterium]|nr:matrixin family metalloprotease [Candidatus Limnocylindria bacterium]
MTINRILCVLILVLTAQLGLSAGAQTNAARYTYELIGGVANRQYWIDPAMINPFYGTLSRNAVSSWNYVGGTLISFAETTDRTQSEEDFYAMAYGRDKDWVGVTVMRRADGTGVVACVGCIPFENWVYAEISLNDSWLADPALYPDSREVQSVAAHEFGHGIGLDHTNVFCALMWPDTSNFLACGSVLYAPRDDDIQHARTLPGAQ